MSGRKVLQRNGAAPEYNIALVGALGVGKSALTVKYITKRFIMEYDPELEGTYRKQEEWDNQDLQVNIMDTCDKEDRDPVRYLKWADGFLVVYSITSRQSFEKARQYLEIVNAFIKANGKDCPVALVGNKIDLERYRQISCAEGAALASEFECLFFETAAAEEFERVENIFHRLVHDIHHEKYGHLMQPLFISEEKVSSLFNNHQRRPKSPRDRGAEKKDEKNPQKKTPWLFKIFN